MKKVKVTKNGPYLVSGNVPLAEQIVVNDKNNDQLEWKRGKSFSVTKDYALCRCGGSKNKPFCDGKHSVIGFRGKETAKNDKYEDNIKTINGPGLILKDKEDLCAGAGFCHRMTGTWNLTFNSNDKASKRLQYNRHAIVRQEGLLHATRRQRKLLNQSLSFLSVLLRIQMPESAVLCGCGEELNLNLRMENYTKQETG